MPTAISFDGSRSLIESETPPEFLPPPLRKLYEWPDCPLSRAYPQLTENRFSASGTLSRRKACATRVVRKRAAPPPYDSPYARVE